MCRHLSGLREHPSAPVLGVLPVEHASPPLFMNPRFTRSFTCPATGVSVLFLGRTLPVTSSHSQTAELSPFLVEAISDRSCIALNSNSITGLNSGFEKLPLSAAAITATFREDTGSTTLENTLRPCFAGIDTRSAVDDVGGIPTNRPI